MDARKKKGESHVGDLTKGGRFGKTYFSACKKELAERCGFDGAANYTYRSGRRGGITDCVSSKNNVPSSLVKTAARHSTYEANSVYQELNEPMKDKLREVFHYDGPIKSTPQVPAMAKPAPEAAAPTSMPLAILPPQVPAMAPAPQVILPPAMAPTSMPPAYHAHTVASMPPPEAPPSYQPAMAEAPPTQLPRYREYNPLPTAIGWYDSYGYFHIGEPPRRPVPPPWRLPPPEPSPEASYAPYAYDPYGRPPPHGPHYHYR